MHYCVDREIEGFGKALYKGRGRMQISPYKALLCARNYRGRGIKLRSITELNLWHEDSSVSGGALIIGPSTLQTDPVVDCVLGMGKWI